MRCNCAKECCNRGGMKIVVSDLDRVQDEAYKTGWDDSKMADVTQECISPLPASCRQNEEVKEEMEENMKGAMRAKLKRHRNKTSRLVDSESETADDVGGIASVSNHKTQLVASTCGFASTRSASGTPKPKKKKRTQAYVGQESSNKKKRPNSLGFTIFYWEVECCENM